MCDRIYACIHLPISVCALVYMRAHGILIYAYIHTTT